MMGRMRRRRHYVLSEVSSLPAGRTAAAGLVLVIGITAAWMNLGRLHYEQYADSILPSPDQPATLDALLLAAGPLRHAGPAARSTSPSSPGQPFVPGMDDHDGRAARPVPGRALHRGATASAAAVGALANTFLIIVANPGCNSNGSSRSPTRCRSAWLSADYSSRNERRRWRSSPGWRCCCWRTGSAASCSCFCFRSSCSGGNRLLGRSCHGSRGGWRARVEAIRPGTPTSLVMVEMSEWPTGWLQLLRTTSAWLVHPIWAIAIVGVAAAGFAHWASGRARESLTPAAVTGAAGLVYWLIVGTSEHVRANSYFPRYVFPALMLFSVALAIVLVEPLRPLRRTARTMTVALMMTTTVTVYGTPSIPRLHRELTRRFGAMTTDVLATGATVIVGDYWTVWPAVFHANLVLYQRGGRGRNLRVDLSVRSHRSVMGGSAAVTGAPGCAATYARENRAARFRAFGVPVSFVEHWPTLDLYLASSPAF